MAAYVSTAVAAQPPVSAQVVANTFVQQYYHILHRSPGLVHQFYHDCSKFGRPDGDGSMSIATTMQGINDKIVMLNCENFRTEIKSVDAQESFGGGFQVLVTGYLIRKDNTVRSFTQAFFLAPQETGYFVLNDMLRYIDSVDMKPEVLDHAKVPLIAEPVPAPVLENQTVEHNSSSCEKSIAGEVCNPYENRELRVVEEVPIVEVVDDAQNNSQLAVESSAKLEEVTKKSYASIVMDLKEHGATFSLPVSTARKNPQMNGEQQNSTFVPATDEQVTNSESSAVNENNQEEADGYSIYIRGLPFNATNALLDEVFKKFGTIKSGGIQVRINRQQGFCFGFVEFEESQSVQKALEASPIAIGGWECIVEEKRSTNSRGNNRGRFQYARFSGHGFRGRGNHGSNRSYGRGEFNGRNAYYNSNGNREGSSNHDGYPRSENVGSNRGRMNPTGWVPNSNSKNMTPQVSASA